MNWFEGLIVKLIGKRLDASLDKWHISKTKIISWLGVIVTLVPQVSTLLGHPIVVPKEVLEILAALGLWALKDGQTPPPPPPAA